jgi:hypothetical protein
MPSWIDHGCGVQAFAREHSQVRSTRGHDDGLALALTARWCSRAALGRALRWWPGQQGLDAHHAPAFARRAVQQRHAGQPQVAVAVVLVLVMLGRRWRRDAEQRAAAFELGITRSVGQQGVVPDALPRAARAAGSAA